MLQTDHSAYGLEKQPVQKMTDNGGRQEDEHNTMNQHTKIPYKDRVSYIDTITSGHKGLLVKKIKTNRNQMRKGDYKRTIAKETARNFKKLKCVLSQQLMEY